jgi:hypothetical protein
VYENDFTAHGYSHQTLPRLPAGCRPGSTAPAPSAASLSTMVAAVRRRDSTAAGSLRERGVRLVQHMQVGPWIALGIQL